MPTTLSASVRVFLAAAAAAAAEFATLTAKVARKNLCLLAHAATGTTRKIEAITSLQCRELALE